MIIYIAINKINKKVYIGQTINSLENRIKKHYKGAKRGSDTKFHRALRKYSKDDFIWSILDVAFDMNELNNKEQYYINEYNSMNDGYNLQYGGKNCVISDITKNKLKKIAIRQWENKNHPHEGKTYEELYGDDVAINIKEKIRQGNLGKIVSDDFRKHMSDITMGRIFSEEHKRNISKSLIGNKRHLGKKHTDETKKKISYAKKGKISHNAIPIIQLDKDGNFIKEWRSASFAADTLGISQGNIHAVINGKRKTASGYKWKVK